MSYTETVRLPYTLWYDGKDKTIRMDMNSILSDEYYENGKKHISKIRNFVVGSYNTEGDVLPPTTADGQYLDASALATIVYNEQKHYTDITLKSHSTYNADGEIILWIDFEMYTGFEEYISDHSYQKKSVALIIPFRSHENPSKNPGRFNDGVGIERLDLRNGMAHTVGAKDEPIVFSFDLIKRDITDEFITSGQALDLITEKRIVDARLNVNDSGLGLSLNYKSYDPIPWETLQQHLGSGSNSTEYVPPTLDEIINSWYNADNSRKSDFANAVGSKMTLSVSENSTKDIDVFVVRDVMTLNGQPTKSHELLFTIPRSLLGGEGQPVDVDSLKREIYSNVGKNISYKDLYYILISFSNPEDHTYAQDIITALLNKYFQSDEYYTQHPEELENGFGNKLINHTTNLLDKITKDAADREKAGKLFQKLLDAETLNVVEQTDGYELSYSGDVNKVLVKIPKQAITVSQEALTAALTENVVTETIKPTLDKSYYSKQEVDQLIQQLKHELMSEDHGEEHPQQ